MKCKCGNELGKPLVSPRPLSFLPYGKPEKDRVHIMYMAGFDQLGKCWFCGVSR